MTADKKTGSNGCGQKKAQMAADKTTGSNGCEQNNRLKWLRTKKQTQIAANITTGSNGCGQKTKSAGYMYTTAASIIKTTSTDTQLEDSFAVCGFRLNPLNVTLHREMVLIYRMDEREILFRLLVDARDLSLPQNIQTGTEV